jgi:endonuclease/exonuclease/phosphatase family metal-dependent hydrolase
MTLRALSFLAAALGLALSFSCGGGDGGPSQRILVINQNILHGIGDEDPDAEDFDRFPERIELIAGALRAAQPDVVTLQEVVANPGEDYPDARVIVLDALGPGYSAVSGAFTGAPINSGGLGQMSFTRLQILSSENRTVSAIRAVHRVTLQTEFGPLSFYNAHLEGTGAVLETGAPAELEEVQNVIDFIEETRAGGPAVLAGDLNAEPDARRSARSSTPASSTPSPPPATRRVSSRATPAAPAAPSPSATTPTTSPTTASTTSSSSPATTSTSRSARQPSSTTSPSTSAAATRSGLPTTSASAPCWSSRDGNPLGPPPSWRGVPALGRRAEDASGHTGVRAVFELEERQRPQGRPYALAGC